MNPILNVTHQVVNVHGGISAPMHQTYRNPLYVGKITGTGRGQKKRFPSKLIHYFVNNFNISDIEQFEKGHMDITIVETVIMKYDPHEVEMKHSHFLNNAVGDPTAKYGYRYAQIQTAHEENPNRDIEVATGFYTIHFGENSAKKFIPTGGAFHEYIDADGTRHAEVLDNDAFLENMKMTGIDMDNASNRMEPGDFTLLQIIAKENDSGELEILEYEKLKPTEWKDLREIYSANLAYAKKKFGENAFTLVDQYLILASDVNVTAVQT